MIGYVVRRTGKIHKKKLGFMKAKRAEIVVVDALDDTHTISQFWICKRIHTRQVLDAAAQ